MSLLINFLSLSFKNKMKGRDQSIFRTSFIKKVLMYETGNNSLLLYNQKYFCMLSRMIRTPKFSDFLFIPLHLHLLLVTQKLSTSGLDFCKQEVYYVHNNLRIMCWSFYQLVKCVKFLEFHKTCIVINDKYSIHSCDMRRIELFDI